MIKMMTTFDVSDPEGRWLCENAHERKLTIPEIVEDLIRREMERCGLPVRLDPSRIDDG